MDSVGVAFSATALTATLAAIGPAGVASTAGSTAVVRPIIAAVVAVVMITALASLVTVGPVGDDLTVAATTAAVIAAAGAWVVPRAMVPLRPVAGRGGTLGFPTMLRAGRVLASTAMVGLVGAPIP